jgi:hypothetical protein
MTSKNTDNLRLFIELIKESCDKRIAELEKENERWFPPFGTAERLSFNIGYSEACNSILSEMERILNI